MSLIKATCFAVVLVVSLVYSPWVLAQAGTTPQTKTPSGTGETSEVLMSTDELRSLVGRIQRTRAARTMAQPMYYYAPQDNTPNSGESNAALNERMARIEQSLDILIRNAGAQPPASVQPRTIIQQQPVASTPNSKEMELLQYELVQLRSELNSTRARLNERILMQAESPADERLIADQQRAMQKQQEDRDRDARRDSERLRDEIRDLEKAVSKRTTIVAPVPIRSEKSSRDTVVQIVTPSRDTALANMLIKQEAQLSALRNQLAANEAARQKPAPEPTIVYRDREVVRQAAPVRVTDTLRIERTIERTAAPKIIDVSAVLFKVGSSLVEPRNDNALSQAADSYRQRLGTVQLRGWSSPEGNAANNRLLSLKRARAVRDELVLRGVPPTAIRILDGGIDTESLSRNVARRVEIQLLIN